MIYGQFLEHFHRQVYGGVYDPKSKFADEDFIITSPGKNAELFTLSGDDKNSYNDIDNEKVVNYKNNECLKENEGVIEVKVKAHSVNVLTIKG